MEFAVPEIITAIAVVISPFITALFLKTTMSSTTKNWIAVGVSAVIAIGYVFLSGGFSDPTDLAVPLGLAYGIGQFLYNSIMKKPATKIEANYGLVAKKTDEPKEVIVTEHVDGSEAVVAVDETVADAYKEDESPKG